MCETVFNKVAGGACPDGDHTTAVFEVVAKATIGGDGLHGRAAGTLELHKVLVPNPEYHLCTKASIACTPPFLEFITGQQTTIAVPNLPALPGAQYILGPTIPILLASPCKSPPPPPPLMCATQDVNGNLVSRPAALFYSWASSFPSWAQCVQIQQGSDDSITFERKVCLCKRAWTATYCTFPMGTCTTSSVRDPDYCKYQPAGTVMCGVLVLDGPNPHSDSFPRIPWYVVYCSMYDLCIAAGGICAFPMLQPF